jgi:hypothetical protein
MKEIIAQFPVNQMGYGVAGSNILYELDKIAKVSLFPIGGVEITDKRIEETFFRTNVNPSLPLFTTDFSSPTVKIWHQHQLMDRIGRGKYYGFPIFELDSFSRLELYSLSAPDELIVCSQWAKTVLEKFVKQKVSVVPLGIDTDIFYPEQYKERKSYRFFTIGKWEVRKAHDVIVECFNRAFSLEDDVQLHMLCHNPFLNEQQTRAWVDICENCELSGKVFVHPRANTHQDVADFIRQMDCGVFPAKAEGWNLELLESMACGNPVITTNYSAHTEFCNKDNSYLVEIDDLEPAYDGIWFDGNKGSWAYIGESQKEQIIEHMRYCYKNRPYNNEGVATGRSFTWENSAKKLLEII